MKSKADYRREALARVNRLNKKQPTTKLNKVLVSLDGYGKGIFDWSKYFKYRN